MAKKKIFVMSSAAIEAACGAALDAIAARTAAKIEESSVAATVDVQAADAHGPSQSPPEAPVKSRRRSG